MYFQIDTVWEQYELADGHVSKGRQLLLCEKEQTLYGLKEYGGSERKAEFMYQLGQYLKEQGMAADYLVPTKDGACLTEGMDGVRYTLHRWYRGKECDIRNRSEILQAVAALANFHQICRNFVCEGYLFGSMEDPYEEYLRHTKELKKIYRFVSKRKKKSEYESLFLSCFHEFYDQCQELLASMEEKQLILSQDSYHICHGDFHQHNVLFVLGRPVLLNLERAGYGLQIFDFCNFTRKVMEKHCWDEELGISMLAQYHRICPVNTEQFWQMYYRLAYPEKFWKLADRYYVSSKSWISKQNFEKLEKERRQNPYRQKYLRRLLYFYENIDEKF